MLLSVWLIYAWGGQAYYNVMNLVGLSATPQFLQKLTYLCWNHDPRILQIDTVRWALALPDLLKIPDCGAGCLLCWMLCIPARAQVLLGTGMKELADCCWNVQPTA